MKTLLFGTPGIPASTQPRDTATGIRRVKELGLGAMELEFVQNVNVTDKMVPTVIQAQKETDIVLTCHGQYFVNLASTEPAKVEASTKRMITAAKRMNELGGWSITWHLGFYQGQTKEQAFERICKATKQVVKTLQDQGNKMWIRPETTGKETQWGDVDEVIKLSQEIEQVLPCIDFAHLHARYNGKNNTLEEFRKIMSKIENGLGKEALKNMHIQVCGINYGPKGEKNHLNFKDSDFNYLDLLKVWKEYSIAGVVITESPNIEEDTLFLQQKYNET